MPEALYTASFFHCKPFVCDAFDTRSLLYQYTAQGGGGSFKIETHSRGGLLCIYPPIFLSIPKLSIQKLFLFICKYTYLSKNYLSIYSTLSLGYVLRATMACNFSCLTWPDGFAPAASSSLLFDPPDRQSIGKHNVSDFPSISRTCFFFLLTLSLSLFYSALPISVFHLSILLSEVWLLNFL